MTLETDAWVAITAGAGALGVCGGYWLGWRMRREQERMRREQDASYIDPWWPW